jgi:hypothetical protein
MKGYFALFVLIGTLLVSCSDDDNPSIDCDSTSEVISEETFDSIDTSNYVISDVQLNGNCLEVTIGSSGCDPDLWEMNLYSTNAFYAIYPIQRAVKIELINYQECLAVFEKTISFDLIPFQLEIKNELPLNIEGWNEQIVYEY